MKKSIISLILLCGWVSVAPAASSGDLAENAPDRYVVVQGDTLWSIAGRFLKDPWRWGELWKMNQEQIKNPNRIYPGDVVVLDRSAEEMRLKLLRSETVKLSPLVRATRLPPEPVPTIPTADIEPFLSQPLVVAANQLESAPRIVATQEGRVVLGAGNVAYVQGVSKDKGAYWQIFRRGEALIDPENNETLGYEAIYLGDAKVTKFGDPSTIEIVKSPLEITAGAYLLPAPREVALDSYVPRAPGKNIRGRIVSAYTSLYEIGPNAIVALSKGTRDGLEVGHVLAIYRSQDTVAYRLRESPMYGRTGIYFDAKNPKTNYHNEPLSTRGSPNYGRYGPFGAQFKNDKTNIPAVAIPNERYGLLLVFRVFERAAYALVMQADRPVNVLDVFTSP